MRTSAGTSSDLVSPTIGCSNRPSALSKERSGLRGISTVLNKGRIARTIKQTNPAAKQPISLLVKDPYSGVSIFRRAVNQSRLSLLVISEFLREMEHA